MKPRFCWLQWLLAAAVLVPGAQAARAAGDGGENAPRVLLVTAHPDDETLFAGSVYKIVHSLDGNVDLIVMSNGEGGYRYAALAEPIYGLALTDERIGRDHLPGIRKRELLASGALLGLRQTFFVDQPDRGYTRDVAEVLSRQWDAAMIRSRLTEILQRGGYGFVFVPLPTATTHGAHQAAALLTLEVVAALPAEGRPVVLGVTDGKRAEPRPVFSGRAEYPLTRVRSELPAFEFDRLEKFGYDSRLDYRIIVDWVVAEHKTQGLLQARDGGDDLELFYSFAINDARASAEAAILFARLRGRPVAAGSPVVRTLHSALYTGVCPIDP